MTQTLTTERLKDLTFHRSKLIFPASHEEAAAMARELLANREAQPVLYASEETLAYAKEGEKSMVTWSEPMGDAVIPLYTAPPAPAVPGYISTRQAIANMENHELCGSINVAYKHGWNDFRAAILAQPVSQGYKLVSVGWIDCSFRLPELPKHNIPVLVALGGERESCEALYCQDGKFRFGVDENPIENVTHWMPLPAAPEGGK